LCQGELQLELQLAVARRDGHGEDPDLMMLNFEMVGVETGGAVGCLAGIT
jgi:hypothetical protein